MSQFDNLQQPSKLDLGWQHGGYVSCIIDYENAPLDQGIPDLQIAWFMKQPVPDEALNQLEERERQGAIKYQIDNRIINKWGYPYGATMPKEVKDMIKKFEDDKIQKEALAKKRQKAMIGVQKELRIKELAQGKNGQLQINPADKKSQDDLINSIISNFTSKGR